MSWLMIQSDVSTPKASVILFGGSREIHSTYAGMRVASEIGRKEMEDFSILRKNKVRIIGALKHQSSPYDFNSKLHREWSERLQLTITLRCS